MLERPHAQKWQSELAEIVAYLEHRGIRRSERVEQLENFLRACIEETSENPVLNSFGPEYFVYAFEYIDFFSEHIRTGREIDINTLRRIFGGSFQLREDELAGDDSRNLLLQIRAGSYLAQAGFKTGITDASDVVAMNDRNGYLVECKRVSAFGKILPRTIEAAGQISKELSSVFSLRPGGRKSSVGGIVWLDLTPIFLELRTVFPAVEPRLVGVYLTHSLRQAAIPAVTWLNAQAGSSVRFVVVQASVMIWDLQTKLMQYRVGTYLCPTRHCGWLENRRFRRSTSYLQGYERGPHLA
jgi:hypothetical protein